MDGICLLQKYYSYLMAIYTVREELKCYFQ